MGQVNPELSRKRSWTALPVKILDDILPYALLAFPPLALPEPLSEALYYLDFCDKYDLSAAADDSLSPFLRRLRGKGQTSVQQQQAADAVALYVDLIRGVSSAGKLAPRPETPAREPAFPKGARQSSTKDAPFASPANRGHSR